MKFFHVNHVTLVVAAVLQWLLGWLWYGLIVKKSWTAMVPKEGQKKIHPVFGMVCSLVANLILCFVLVHIVMWAGTMTFLGGASIGVVCWLGFMAPPLFTQHIFEGRPANLFAINAAYWLMAMALGGAVLAAYR